MLKFFRKIRQKLLSENKFSNYLIYAIGEIILVVIGILIALQINNWNEKRKEKAKTQAFYIQLLDDLKEDKAYAQFIIKKFESQRAAYNSYLKQFDTNGVTRSKMYKDLLSLNSESYAINFNMSTLESLQNSGEIVLLPPGLRNSLLELKRSQEKITTDESLDNRAKTSVSEHLSILMGSPSLVERLNNQKDLKAELDIESNTNEIILALESIQGWMDFSELKSIRLLTDLLDEMDEVEKLIKKEIGK